MRRQAVHRAPPCPRPATRPGRPWDAMAADGRQTPRSYQLWCARPRVVRNTSSTAMSPPLPSPAGWPACSPAPRRFGDTRYRRRGLRRGGHGAPARKRIARRHRRHRLRGLVTAGYASRVISRLSSEWYCSWRRHSRDRVAASRAHRMRFAGMSRSSCWCRAGPAVVLLRGEGDLDGVPAEADTGDVEAGQRPDLAVVSVTGEPDPGAAEGLPGRGGIAGDRVSRPAAAPWCRTWRPLTG